MWEKLNALPFVSCKCLAGMASSLNNVVGVIENKGKTLHLLKKQSKPVPQNRKRMKRDIFATPLEFHQQNLHLQQQEEQKHEESEGQTEAKQPLGYVPTGGGPNVIGNKEDGPVLPD